MGFMSPPQALIDFVRALARADAARDAHAFVPAAQSERIPAWFAIFELETALQSTRDTRLTNRAIGPWKIKSRCAEIMQALAA